MKANKAFIKKLNSMTQEELADHYRKVMKGGIGYISKGQKELEDNLIHLGFQGNQQIGKMNVDLCHHKKKIVIEFNGDAYHCNPKKWKKDQYSTLIKMTAGEKWEKDIARYAVLRELGYKVIIVWESDWISSKEECIKNIKEIYENC
jgi:very-short-patch-repair endonuclease